MAAAGQLSLEFIRDLAKQSATIDVTAMRIAFLRRAYLSVTFRAIHHDCRFDCINARARAASVYYVEDLINDEM